MIKQLTSKFFFISFVTISLSISSCKREVHMNVGMQSERLKPCPESPNCVVSQYPEDDNHFIEPWSYTVSHKRARQKLIAILKETHKVNFLKQEETYLHTTFTIPVFGFVDDVEFYLPKNQKIIHFRSASRVGYSDLGVNKRRIKNIRQELLDNGVIEK
jgi:uncharacterized protein (DUF1499 family)